MIYEKNITFVVKEKRAERIVLWEKWWIYENLFVGSW